jgi:hypothetical protein
VARVDHPISMLRAGLGWQLALRRTRGPHEHIDAVVASAVRQRSHRTPAEIIQASTQERKPLSGEVLNWGRKIQLPVEPGRDGMVIQPKFVRTRGISLRQLGTVSR